MEKWKAKVGLFLASQTVTQLGSLLVQMAMIWHMTRTTSSGAWVTVITLCAFVPQTVISLFAGVWADRYSRRTLIIAADAGIAIATLALALWMRRSTAEAMLVPIAVVSAIRSLGAGIQMPAVNAMLPELAPQEHLMRVNGINGSLQAVAQFAAPAIAAILLEHGRMEAILYIDVATAVVGIGLLACLAIPRGRRMPAGEESVLADMAEGVRYAWRSRALRMLLAVYGAYILLSVPSGFLSALLIERTFRGEYSYLSISEMAGFAGMMLGGVVLGTWGGFRRRSRTLVLALCLYGLTTLAIAFAQVFWLYAVLMFFVSLAIPAVGATVTTIVQERVEAEKQGRVFSLVGMMFSGFLPLGMVLFGPLADIVSIQLLIGVCSALILLMAGVVLLAGRRMDQVA